MVRKASWSSWGIRLETPSPVGRVTNRKGLKGWGWWPLMETENQAALRQGCLSSALLFPV